MSHQLLGWRAYRQTVLKVPFVFCVSSGNLNVFIVASWIACLYWEDSKDAVLPFSWESYFVVFKT